MLKLTCHCGQIRVEVQKRPDYINACNCSLCSKAGAEWGYFQPSEVSVEGATSGYSRDDKADAACEIHFCPNCGSTTHFILTASAVARFGNVQTGVNMRLADEKDLAGVELRYPDGRSWSGAGEFGYVREARIIGASAASAPRAAPVPTLTPQAMGFFSEWRVVVAWPDGRTKRVGGFRDEEHARGWIEHESAAWLAREGRASR